MRKFTSLLAAAAALISATSASAATLINGFELPASTDLPTTIVQHLERLIEPSAIIPSLPEPGTWMTMLLGFAFVGFAARTRRKKAARSA